VCVVHAEIIARDLDASGDARRRALPRDRARSLARGFRDLPRRSAPAERRDEAVPAACRRANSRSLETSSNGKSGTALFSGVNDGSASVAEASREFIRVNCEPEETLCHCK
jgi:hypothetical protein